MAEKPRVSKTDSQFFCGLRDGIVRQTGLPRNFIALAQLRYPLWRALALEHARQSGHCPAQATGIGCVAASTYSRHCTKGENWVVVTTRGTSTTNSLICLCFGILCVLSSSTVLGGCSLLLESLVNARFDTLIAEAARRFPPGSSAVEFETWFVGKILDDPAQDSAASLG
jgi:hypothetical protein